MRLRWTIGGVTITSLAESETPTSPRFLFEAMSKAEVVERTHSARWLRPSFVSKDGYLLQKIQSLIVDTGDYRIVVDTCVGNDKERKNPLWNRQQVPFIDDLARAGYPTESISHVVCTHLHADHVGWNTRLVGDQWLPTFPGARYLFADSEYEHWKNAPVDYDEDTFADSVAPIVGAGLADLVPTTHRICDEVSFVPTPGHTPGHISVLITSGDARAVITGDMLHHPLQFIDPDLGSVFDTNPVQARETRRAAFARWADGSTLVIGTHFGSPTAGMLVPDGDTYRFDA